MHIVFFSSKPYEKTFFDAANSIDPLELTYLEARLTPSTARAAKGADAVCVFVNDVVNEATLKVFAADGVKLVALRCAGFNNVDLNAAKKLGITVCRVPAYSPHAVAEHTLALILALDRNIARAYNRVREGNFALDGLMGFDLKGKTAGVIGTGRIGTNVVRILRGFGCKVLTSDVMDSAECEALGAKRVSTHVLLASSDLVSLHCPLAPDTRHMIDAEAISTMRRGVMLVNTSRGALIDTKAVIAGLKCGHIGSLALDVYEEEGGLFFEDQSEHVMQDDVFARLLTFPNVLITGHQGFFTREAMQAIARTTLDNIIAFATSGRAGNLVPLPVAA